MIYTVRSGDTVYSIARKLGTQPERIINDNGLTSPEKLTPGEDLVILYPLVTYTVKEGDTLYSIAEKFATDTSSLFRNNPQLHGIPDIKSGDTLTISFASPPALGKIELNGYAYPYISEDVLRRTLPYLTYLSIFTYGLRENGTLVEPENDGRLISVAKEYATLPLMMLTSLTENGNFSNELVVKILSDTDVSDRVINEAVRTARAKGYRGIDVDFEYISSSLSEKYVNFLRTLRSSLPPDMILFASLAPKESSEMRGLLYEGHDYRGVGNAADKVLLMTYEWGYTYGPPMAVSPINKVRQVIEYGVSEISPDKIFMGMPNYGYDWKLPFVKGESMAQSLSNVAAVKKANEKGAEIMYDEKTQSPYFTYYDVHESRPVEHVVWFENAKSTEAMSRLAAEKKLSGISVWNIMNFFPGMWAQLNSSFEIVKK